jgi:hypothetical protein
VDFPGEHPGRRAGDHDLAPFGIEHPAREPLPAGDELDLVEEPGHGLARAQRRIEPIVLLEQEPELVARDVGQPIVVEADVERSLDWHDRASLVDELVQERRLPCPAHADHRMDLPRDCRQVGIPARPGARRSGDQRRVQLIGKDGVKRHRSCVLCTRTHDT